MIKADAHSVEVDHLNKPLSVHIRTYGCQQNVSDSERIGGMLAERGWLICGEDESADLIIFNTCAVREHAEDRVFGHIGALKKLKEQRPQLLIAVGGCMVQQQHIAEKLAASYPFVDIIFNTNRLAELPDMIERCLAERRPVREYSCEDFSVSEGLPVRRENPYRAFIPIMYGCDNFCTYCIVPHVRGRERSRRPEDIEAELRSAVEAGYKDIMLLGQNVNSYGKKAGWGQDFAELLERLNAVEGDFKLRFMTSHPKDATDRLFEAMARCEKVSRSLHLPVQSGSDDILRRMNRRYSSAQYLDLVARARRKVEGISFTSDIIIGFPGETREDFEATKRLVEQVGFYSLFIFIYSKRVGTPAAEWPDETPHSLKAERLRELTALQDAISERYDRELVGQTLRCQVTRRLENGLYEGRLDSNAAVELSGESDENQFRDVRITEIRRRRLVGEII